MQDLHYSNRPTTKWTKSAVVLRQEQTGGEAEIEINGFSNWSTCLSEWRRARDMNYILSPALWLADSHAQDAWWRAWLQQRVPSNENRNKSLFDTDTWASFILVK